MTTLEVPRRQESGPPDDRDFEVVVGRDPRWYAVPAVVALVVGAIALLAAAQSDSTESDPRLLVIDEEGTVSLVDPATGRADFGVPGAIPSGDRSRLVTAEQDVERTVVQGLDARTGAVVAEVEVEGHLAIRAVAPRGGSVALMAHRPTGAGPYEPEPRSSTDITVADLASGRLRAVSSEIVMVDTSTWTVTGRLDALVGREIGLLGHPAGTLVSAPVECAC